MTPQRKQYKVNLYIWIDLGLEDKVEPKNASLDI